MIEFDLRIFFKLVVHMTFSSFSTFQKGGYFPIKLSFGLEVYEFGCSIDFHHDAWPDVSTFSEGKNMFPVNSSLHKNI